MTKDSHEHTKVGLVIDVLVITESNEEFIHQSRDISSTKIVLEPNPNNILSVGSIVDLQVRSLAENEEALIVKSEVTQISGHGIELRFLV